MAGADERALQDERWKGGIDAKLEGIDGSIRRIEKSVETHAKASAAFSETVTKALVRFEEKLDAHEKADDHRFSDLREDIDRAHRKIASAGVHTSFGDEPKSDPERTERVRRATILTSIGTIVAAAIAAAVEWFRNGGR